MQYTGYIAMTESCIGVSLNYQGCNCGMHAPLVPMYSTVVCISKAASKFSFQIITL